MSRPRATVAAVIERNGRFLMVEERADGATVFNQPAGHLEENESLVEAIRREVLEETAYGFTPTGLIGVYQWGEPGNVQYVRFAFAGDVGDHQPERLLDEGIIAAHWLTMDEIRQRHGRLRNPMVLRCLEDFVRGERFPLRCLRVVS